MFSNEHRPQKQTVVNQVEDEPSVLQQPQLLVAVIECYLFHVRYMCVCVLVGVILPKLYRAIRWTGS